VLANIQVLVILATTFYRTGHAIIENTVVPSLLVDDPSASNSSQAILQKIDLLTQDFHTDQSIASICSQAIIENQAVPSLLQDEF